MIAPLLKPSQFHVIREAATAGLSAGLRTTATSVGTSAQANSLFSISSNILLVYMIKRKGPRTLPCGTLETIGIHSLAAISKSFTESKSENKREGEDKT